MKTGEEEYEIRCIYCRKTQTIDRDQKVWPEHYLCKAFGPFKAFEPLWNTVCNDCNKKISKYEEQLLRGTQVGLLRHISGYPRKGSEKNPFYDPTYRVPPLSLKNPVEGPYKDHELEPIRGTSNFELARQIIVISEDESKECIKISESIRRPDQLKALLAKMGLQDATPYGYHASDDEVDWIESLIHGVWGQIFIERSKIDIPITPIEDARVNILATNAMYQAVAKIAFHYVLKFLPAVSGHETAFKRIKSFILSGGNAEDFVEQLTEQWFCNFRVGRVPTNWMHIIQADILNDEILVHVQLYAHAEHPPAAFKVSVGRYPGRIANSFSSCHQYRYYDVISNDTFEGEMIRAENIRLFVVR